MKNFIRKTEKRTKYFSRRNAIIFGVVRKLSTFILFLFENV